MYRFYVNVIKDKLILRLMMISPQRLPKGRDGKALLTALTSFMVLARYVSSSLWDAWPLKVPGFNVSSFCLCVFCPFYGIHCLSSYLLYDVHDFIRVITTTSSYLNKELPVLDISSLWNMHGYGLHIHVYLPHQIISDFVSIFLWANLSARSLRRWKDVTLVTLFCCVTMFNSSVIGGWHHVYGLYKVS